MIARSTGAVSSGGASGSAGDKGRGLMAEERTPGKAKRQAKAAVSIHVEPGTLQRARPKSGEVYAVRVPSTLKDRGARAEFARLLMSSGVASGVSASVDGEWVLVSIDGHRSVRLRPGEWLIVEPVKAYMLEDKAARDRFSFDEPSSGEPAGVAAAPGPSPVVTS